MKLIATRPIKVVDVEPDQGVTLEGKRYVVDEVHRTREGITLSCLAEDNPAVSRRKPFTFKGDEMLTIEAGEEDRRTLLDGLQRLLAGDDHTTVPGVDTFDYDAKAGTLSVHLGGWLILLEA